LPFSPHTSSRSKSQETYSKTIPEKSRNYFKGMKHTRKITKIPGKLPELDWGMSNPNKVFSVQEKDFRAL
jgi:hypothetical protein